MAAESNRIDPFVWRVSFVVIIGSIMSILDTTIVNVALETLSRALHSRISQVRWVSTGYMLSLAAALWASVGLAALANFHCLILIRAERRARAKGDDEIPPEVMAEAVAV